jgi:hypothetical protein
MVRLGLLRRCAGAMMVRGPVVDTGGAVFAIVTQALG